MEQAVTVKRQWWWAATIAAVFTVCYFLPVGSARFDRAAMEALHLVRWYAREHVILCLVPAFFIAGAIGVFLSQASVMKYLGPNANKAVAYGVASVSGSVLAVCSCTVLPLFAGIRRMGAGLGPACAFLYSGPAINVLAIILTGRVLGLELGIARAVGAIVFSILIGLLMHLIFRKGETTEAQAAAACTDSPSPRPAWQNLTYFGAMIGVLVFANWGRPDQATGLWYGLWLWKWAITAGFAAVLAAALALWFGIRWWHVGIAAVAVGMAALALPGRAEAVFTIGVVGLCIIIGMHRGEPRQWGEKTWSFAKQILPLLFAGVLVAGLLLGRPGHEGLIPSQWVADLVGGNSPWANLFAAVVGGLMYFATLTEVPIVEGLIGAGMGKGPALALLLAGPALSLPNMLVIRSVLGTARTLVFVLLVIVMATISGLIYGACF